MADTRQYRKLDAQEIVATTEKLHSRIQARFPGSGLGKVVAELADVARETVERTRWIQKPHFGLRIFAAILTLGILAVLVGLFLQIRQFQFRDYVNSVQALDSSISSVVFIAAAILFLVNWETRIKRRRALEAVHELRALAHIIDMHQLTKDPESYFSKERQPTGQLQRRPMSPFELNRYLDYCSEALAVISKVAALYVQDFQDTVLMDAVDDVEDLTTGFSRKIWQKLTLLETLGRTADALPSPSFESPGTLPNPEPPKP